MAIDLKQFSKMLGLSPTTVSRALNGYPEVATKTRTRVLEAAEATGYKANRVARRLALGSPGAVGIVLPAGGQEHETIGKLLPLLADQIARLGFQLVLFPPLHEEDAAAFASSPADVEAQIWLNPNPAIRQRVRERSRSAPILFVDTQFGGGTNAACVAIDYRAGGYGAAKFLLQLGHRRLHLLLDPTHSGRSELLQQGVEEAVEALSGINSVAEANATVLSPGAIAAELRSSERPTAVICSNMMMFELVAQLAKNSGCIVGRDISIIAQSFTGSIGTCSVGEITSIRWNARQFAAMVVDSMIQLLETPSSRPGTVFLRPELVIGSTTGPIIDPL